MNRRWIAVPVVVSAGLVLGLSNVAATAKDRGEGHKSKVSAQRSSASSVKTAASSTAGQQVRTASASERGSSAEHRLTPRTIWHIETPEHIRIPSIRSSESGESGEHDDGHKSPKPVTTPAPTPPPAPGGTTTNPPPAPTPVPTANVCAACHADGRSGSTPPGHIPI